MARPATTLLPACRRLDHGVCSVDYRAVVRLAWPLFLSFGTQAFINLTDTWFAGRLGSHALAGMNAVHFASYTLLLLFGGFGMAVQTLVAQRVGGGRRTRAAAAVWSALWAALLATPVMIAIGLLGEPLFAPFRLPETVEREALAYWTPRLAGGGLVVANWALANFYNGIGRTRVSMLVALFSAGANVGLNALLIFGLELGMFGAGLASTLAVAFGTAVLAWLFLRRSERREFRTTLLWKPRLRELRRLISLGLPIGVHSMLDVGSFAAFQLMIARLAPVQGAATQIAMMLTSAAFLPCVGLNFAAATLVGQSRGAGDNGWASRVGNACIKLALGYMVLWGAAFAVGGQWLVSLFVVPGSFDAAAIVALGRQLLWIAAAYQLFDALNLGSLGCLRGAGDVRVPAMLLIAIAWLVFVPLAHLLIFAPGEGWIAGAPGLGLGATGGWIAALVHLMLLGSFLFLRWRSRRWAAIPLG